MSIICFLFPKSDAEPAELKALGIALSEWVKREMREGGMLDSIALSGLDDLLLGELPQPLALRIANSHSSIGEHLDLHDIQFNLGSSASERFVNFSLKDHLLSRRNEIIQNLRQALPAELIEDIIIGELSWND